MKRWVKKHRDGIIIAIVVVVFLIVGAVADYCTPSEHGGLTLSEMEAMVEEVRGTNVEID